MKKITSFTINHLDHNPGIYLSRQDGDVFTYDVRICKPYVDPLLTNAEMHSLEHLLATVMRSAPYQDDVVYVGPMGCQTGFYVLFRNVDLPLATKHVTDAFKFIASYDGEMPGKDKIECGNCLNLSVDLAVNVAKIFLSRI